MTTLTEAADAFEKLKAERDRLRKALEQIRYWASSHTVAIHDNTPGGFGDIYKVAKQALAEEE